MTNKEIYTRLNKKKNTSIKWMCRFHYCYQRDRFLNDSDYNQNHNTYCDFLKQKVSCKECGSNDYVLRFWNVDHERMGTALIEIKKWFVGMQGILFPM